MTQNVMRVVRKKRRLWHRYTQTKDFREYQAYKKVEQEVGKALRTAKRNFERNLAKNTKKNPKAFYSYLKKKTNNKVIVGPLSDDDGNTVKDAESMANILNSFFGSVFTQKNLSKLRSPRRFTMGMLHCHLLRFSGEK